MKDWTETCRSSVAAWECDVFAHLTIAYYFDRLSDAALAMLAELGESAADWRTAELVIRYEKEFRAGDGFFVETALLGADGASVRLAHRLRNSASGEQTTRVEHLLAAVSPRPGKPALAPAAIEWERLGAGEPVANDTPKRVVPSARDSVRAGDLDAAGRLSLRGYVHRFTTASLHALTSFGMNADYMRTNRRGFATFETRLRLHQEPPPAGTLLATSSGVLQIGKSSIRLAHHMVEARSGKPVATFIQSGVQLDLDARRSAPWPEELRRAGEAASGV